MGKLLVVLIGMGLMMIPSSAPIAAYFTTTSQINVQNTIFAPVIISVDAPFEQKFSMVRSDQSIHFCYEFLSTQDLPGFDEPALTIQINQHAVHQTSFAPDYECIFLPVEKGEVSLHVTVHDTIDEISSPMVRINQVTIVPNSIPLSLESHPQVFDLTIERVDDDTKTALVSLKIATPLSTRSSQRGENTYLKLYPLPVNSTEKTSLTTAPPSDLEVSNEPEAVTLLTPHQPFWRTFVGQQYQDNRFPDHKISFVTARIPQGHWFAKIQDEFIALSQANP